MKKLAVFFLSLSLLLSACGGPAPEKAESFTCGTGENQCFAMSGDTLISATGNGVRGFDLTGETVFDVRSDMAHPAVCSNGSDAVICDVGGSAIVYDDGSVLSFENIIISASLSEGGCLAVCAEEPGYKGAVTVYSPEKSPVYKWYSAERRTVGAAVSPDGERLAVLCAGETGGEIHIFTLDSEQTQGVYSAPEMLSEVFWLDKTICGIGGSGLYYCDAEGRDKGGYEFGKFFPGSFRVWDDKLIIELRAHSSGGAGELVIIDDRGSELGRISPGEELISLDCGDDGILCLTQSRVTLYDTDYSAAFSADMTGAEAAFLRQAGDILAVGSGNARAIEY